MQALAKSKQRILFFPNAALAFNEACLSLTPKVFSVKKTLFLDIEPTLKLFGGEERILHSASQLTQAFGLPPHWILTDRPEWAQALYTSPEVVIPPGKSFERLLSLDISRLIYCGDPSRLELEFTEKEELTRFMKRVGMRRVQDFAHLSVTAIGRRFGKAGVRLLEYILGEREVILPTFIPESRITETIETDEISNLDSLLHEIEIVLSRIEARLRGRALQAKGIHFTFYLESGQEISETLPFSEPLHEAERMLAVLRVFLQALHWESPLQNLSLTLTETVPHTKGQLSLFDKKENLHTDLNLYLARLRNRFGEANVGFPTLLESYLPERAWKVFSPSLQKKQDKLTQLPNLTRPLFLFQPALLCTPQNNWKLVPTENLMSEWWTEGGFRRYFIATPPLGNPLWIYWDLEKLCWYTHGTFD